MKQIYISSTSKDLGEFRKAASTALEKIRHVAVRMENYVARSQRTRAACEADVAGCDIYVGIFAWRYGESPKDDNVELRSFTELEYRRAAADKPCLIFLLRDEAEWPDILRDAKNGEGDNGERIRKLRAELKENHSPAYFSTPQELATEVIAAVYQHESTKRVEQLNVLEEIKESFELGPSYLPNIQTKIMEGADAEIVAISIGPTRWWTTRLHLVAALASDFTRIRQFVFLDGADRFLLMASPNEVRRALTRRVPQLERAYLASRPEVSAGAAMEIDHIVMMYSEQIFNAFNNRKEAEVKEDVSAMMLQRDLGIELSAEEVEQGGPRLLQQRDIVRRKTPFVALVLKGKLISVIDRLQMASKIALQSLEEPIG
jgi:hypothetical protein